MPEKKDTYMVENEDPKADVIKYEDIITNHLNTIRLHKTHGNIRQYINAVDVFRDLLIPVTFEKTKTEMEEIDKDYRNRIISARRGRDGANKAILIEIKKADMVFRILMKMPSITKLITSLYSDDETFC